MSTPKVFISATTADLASMRQVVKDALLAKGCHPIEQTNFPPDARTVSEMLSGRIGECQALIHIVGLRYGAEPDPATLPPGAPRRSYTQMEYDIGRELQAKRGDKRFRVYTFLCPPGFPYDNAHGTAPEPEDKQELQRLHRAAFLANPHLREEPADSIQLRERILTLQEEMHQLRARQTFMARIAFAVMLTLALALVGVVWSVRQVKEDTGSTKETAEKIVTAQQESAKREADLASQMSQVQEALARIQQNSDPKDDPISKWPQDRLEAELAKQMKLDVAALRALLTAGKTSVDALVAGQALLASGNQKEANAKFDVVLQQEKDAAQRMQQAWEGKAQIAYGAVRYEEALAYRQKAAALVDKAEDPVAWTKAHAGVALILKKLARYKEAEPLMREIVRLRETGPERDTPELAKALNSLAMLLRDTNRLAEGEPMLRRALEIDEASYGKDHPDVATDLTNLALLLRDTNRLAEAEQLYRRALEIDEASYGKDDPSVATDLSNLAQLVHSTNRLAEAEPMYRRALAIDEAAYGKNHPEVAIDLNTLAQLLKETNRFAEAEPMMRRALAIDEASYGKDHPKVAIRLITVAWLLQATGRLAEAEPLMRRALAIDEVSYGKDHPEVATDLSNLAQLLKATNRLAEAEPLMRRAVEISVAFKQSTGYEHPRYQPRLQTYSNILEAMGLSKEAIAEKMHGLK